MAPGEVGGQLLGGLQKTQVTQHLLSAGSCPGDMFTCRNTQCVWKENPECDGQKDCDDASDERGCGKSLTAGLLDMGDRPQPTAADLDSCNTTGLGGTEERQGHSTTCQAKSRCLHQDKGNCTLGTPWSHHQLQRVMTRPTFLVSWHAGQAPHAHKLLGADHEAVAVLVKLAKIFLSRISCFRRVSGRML